MVTPKAQQIMLVEKLRNGLDKGLVALKISCITH
jgi:hypothetical protein